MVCLTKFKDSLQSINELIYFDSNQFLREKSSNPSKIKEVIDEAVEILEGVKAVSKEDKYFLYGTLGNFYRIYGMPKKAIDYLMWNLNYSIAIGDSTREIITLIRFGEALKYDNKHEEALEKFNQALVKCKVLEGQSYVDFALQHKGKCLLELNRAEEAIICFQEALEIRKLKGDSSLIDSTVKALEFTEALL